MSEDRPKKYYEKMKELLEFLAFLITIVVGLLTILANVYIPNSVAFEAMKYLFLVMIPITASIILLRFSLRGFHKELEVKQKTKTFPDLEKIASQFDERIGKIEKDIRIIQSYFSFKCPNCSNPMFLPILPSMVIRSKTHEKDGHPDKYLGDPEYEIGCPSCQKTWHIVFRR